MRFGCQKFALAVSRTAACRAVPCNTFGLASHAVRLMTSTSSLQDECTSNFTKDETKKHRTFTTQPEKIWTLRRRHRFQEPLEEEDAPLKRKLVFDLAPPMQKKSNAAIPLEQYLNFI
mmetsp:Transcript_29378/g.57653  ORF Transcript_29378/g.57653 Transcript_29378/m.57653 type:complete len:118 (+) Transcript_29378:56-409(+)